MAETDGTITDQRVGVRPIAFIIQNGEEFSTPINLRIRPTDLTVSYPSRVTVHQTIGRGQIKGWGDDFGEGLPSCVLSGHTGWRYSKSSQMDGVKAFLELQKMIKTTYHDLRQQAIKNGTDPDVVKLIFVDMLDEFTWSVTPIAFALQRSKSQPLLMKYNMQLQALDTNVKNPIVILPPGQNIKDGLNALERAINKLKEISEKIQGFTKDAIAKVDGAFSTVAKYAKDFHDLSTAVFDVVNMSVSSVKDITGAVANNLIGIASDIAQVGINLNRTLASIQSLPSYLKAELSNVANAFNEVKCIFKNSLKPNSYYEDYSDLNGASNCSSTTGGGPASIYSGSNPFAKMQPTMPAIGVSGEASASIKSLGNSDPVLAPMSINEMGRNLRAINDGVVINQYSAAA
jgi:hypothetical protein